jgi:integrase
MNQGWVPVKLRYGVKGGKVEPSSSLSLRSRTVEVPIDLAERIWNYKNIVRPTLLRRLVREGASKDTSENRLWIGEKKKQPVSNQMLYKAWTQSLKCPKGWNPHDGRHFFAVKKICDHTRLMIVHHGNDDPRAINVGWLHGLMAGYVRLILSPLLGHVREDTTMRYLKCALQRLVEAFGHPALDWNDHLDSEL